MQGQEAGTALSMDGGFIFALALFFFFRFYVLGPAPWVTEKSYYHLIFGAGIQLFTYS